MKSKTDPSLFRKPNLTALSWRSRSCVSRAQRLRGAASGVAGAAFLLMLCSVLAGCGVATDPQLGVISVASSPVAIYSQAGVSVALGQNPENLAVTWTVTCGGSPIAVPVPAPAGYTNPDPNPCGTFSSAYGASTIYTAPPLIPTGTTVTITAAAASDPSIRTSVTFPITSLPIQIAISTPQPSTVGVNGTSVLVATVTNDDTAAAGVLWSLSCSATGMGACGTLNSGLPNKNQTASTGQMTYTAPSTVPAGGIVVTFTATSVTDPTVSRTAAVTIAPISVSVKPATATVPVLTTANLTATVLYDSANLGVDWGTPTCGSPGACGSVSLLHTDSGVATVYTPPLSIPSGGTVTIVTRSTASPGATATVTITIVPPPPIVVNVTPPTASAQFNGPVTLTATVLNDQANAGADWTLTCGSATGDCGTLTTHTAGGAQNIYTAPSSVPPGGIVIVTATSHIDNRKSATSSITILPTIMISLSPANPASVTAGTGSSFAATVTNDVAGAGVVWSVTCTNPPCGTFTQTNTASGAATTFTVPIGAPAGTVTITATSTASTTALPVQSVSATVTVVPVIAVNFVAFAPSQLQVSNQVNGFYMSPPVSLVAAVLNDPTSAGVDWSLSGSASDRGQFQKTPAMPATATTQAVNATYASTVHTASGQAAIYFPPVQAPGPNQTVIITAKASNQGTPSSPLATATAQVSIVATASGVPLNGVVMAGTHPVNGATVSLYAAGTTGYLSGTTPPLTPVTQATTSANGQFSIPAGYTCPSQSSEMYLVALGGNAGQGTNQNSAMMTALGPCSGLSSAVNVTINEVTTVGSVWPLAPFMTAYDHVGSSPANATAGMANAFAAVNNLVNISTGVALTATPAGNGIVPQAEINTLADVLNTCSVTSGGAVGDGSACGALFAVANPTPLQINPSPTDTLQAALDLAHLPLNNVVAVQGNPLTIYSLLPLPPNGPGPFLPVLTSPPNDWTIAISFTGGGLGGTSQASSRSTALAIDAAGDVWIANTRIGTVTELNSLGAALSPFTTGTTLASVGGYKGGGLSSPSAIAIDPLGNVWLANNSSLTELSPGGTGQAPTFSPPYNGGGLSQIKGMAIDGTGNIWAINAGSPVILSWIAGANTTVGGNGVNPGYALSPGITNPALTNPTGAIAIDTLGTVWVLNSVGNSGSAVEFSSGNYVQTDVGHNDMSTQIPTGSVLTSSLNSGMAIDNSGDVFLPVGSPPNILAELFAGGSSFNAGGLGTSAFTPANVSAFLALDGAKHLWTIIESSASCNSPAISVLEMSTSASALNINSQGCGYSSPVIGTPAAIAVDGSGNVWVLNGANSSTVTEFIGVAAPVVTPFSAGLQCTVVGSSSKCTLGKEP